MNILVFIYALPCLIRCHVFSKFNIESSTYFLQPLISFLGQNISIGLYKSIRNNSNMVQWLGFLPFTQAARVRFPVWENIFQYFLQPLISFLGQNISIGLYKSIRNNSNMVQMVGGRLELLLSSTHYNIIILLFLKFFYI